MSRSSPCDSSSRVWYDYAAANIPDVLKEIAVSGDLSDDTKEKLGEAAKGYKQTATMTVAGG